MDVVRFISQSLEQVHIRLLGTCDGLTKEQVLWRPTPQANNIGFILWHIGRFEEVRVNSLRPGQKHLWETQGWHEKFGQPIDSPDPGDRMGLRALNIPSLDVLIGYMTASHEQTRAYLSTLSTDELDKSPDPSQPKITPSSTLRHLITHKNNHHGQIDYIRGLQDETWDLPRGTGMVLPS